MTYIRTERRGPVVVLTLDDPGRRNALSLDLNSELIAAIDECEADEQVCAIVVTGTPPAFCAGADLSQLGASRRDGLEAIYNGFLRVADCALPTIAAVNGPAVGAGMNLALACDLRIAADSARFDTRFLTLGIHPGGGHTWMMTRATAIQTTLGAVLFGEVLDAAEAVRTGLVWRATDDEQLLDVAVAMAGRAARGGRELAIRTKATIRATASMADHQRAIAAELETQLWSMEQPGFAELLDTMKSRISGRTQH